MNNLNKDEKLKVLEDLQEKYCSVTLVPLDGENPILEGFIGRHLIEIGTGLIRVELLDENGRGLSIPIDKIISIQEINKE